MINSTLGAWITAAHPQLLRIHLTEMINSNSVSPILHKSEKKTFKPLHYLWVTLLLTELLASSYSQLYREGRIWPCVSYSQPNLKVKLLIFKTLGFWCVLPSFLLPTSAKFLCKIEERQFGRRSCCSTLEYLWGLKSTLPIRNCTNTPVIHNEVTANARATRKLLSKGLSDSSD